jgi:DNA-directed RNA polymerase specialized sigma24 family protein
LLKQNGREPAVHRVTARSASPLSSDADADRFRELVDRFAASLLSSLRSRLPEQDARDVLHDALLSARVQLAAIPTNPDDALEELLRIAFVAADGWRRRVRREARRFPWTPEPGDLPDSGAIAQWIEDKLFIYKALRAVKQPFRDVLEMYYLDGLSTATIAERKGVSKDAVRTWRWRGEAELVAAMKRKPTPRKAKRGALIIPVALADLDPIDRAILRALRDAERPGPITGGGGPPSSTPSPTPLAPTVAPVAPTITPHAFAALLTLGSTAALVAALLSGPASDAPAPRVSPVAPFAGAAATRAAEAHQLSAPHNPAPPAPAPAQPSTRTPTRRAAPHSGPPLPSEAGRGVDGVHRRRPFAETP